MVNAGPNGETSAAGRRRIGWLLKRRVDVLVLELGANDGLRGVSPAETERNLQEILNAVKTRYPQAALVLAGMQLPPNLGPGYTAQVQALFPRLAKRNQAARRRPTGARGAGPATPSLPGSVSAPGPRY